MCKLAWALNSEGTQTGDLPRGAAQYWQEIPPPWCQHKHMDKHTKLAQTRKLIAQLIGTEAAGNDQSASHNVMIAVPSPPIVLALASSPVLNAFTSTTSFQIHLAGFLLYHMRCPFPFLSRMLSLCLCLFLLCLIPLLQGIILSFCCTGLFSQLTILI